MLTPFLTNSVMDVMKSTIGAVSGIFNVKKEIDKESSGK